MAASVSTSHSNAMFWSVPSMAIRDESDIVPTIAKSCIDLWTGVMGGSHTVGTLVLGSSVGATVGVLVGGDVDIVVGASVGVAEVGLPVGNNVGLSVGRLTGLGAEVGERDGFIVGGMLVGELVRDSDGVKVGSCVG